MKKLFNKTLRDLLIKEVFALQMEVNNQQQVIRRLEKELTIIK